MKNMATIPKDFSTVVKDIKLAILQARAKAARLADVFAIRQLATAKFGEAAFRHLRKCRNSSVANGRISANPICRIRHRNIPQPYKTLAPVIDGVRKVLVEYKRESAKEGGKEIVYN